MIIMIEFIEKIARSAGEICLCSSQTMSEKNMEFKGIRDLVTTADREVENFLVREIRARYPDHSIIGEEGGTRLGRMSDKEWIIDPIDGTVSFFHGQPYYSISIAFREQGVLQAAVVYAPALRQFFSAERGQGAYLNGIQRLQVSTVSVMINAVLATGFACLRAGREPNNLIYLNRILPRIRDMRRCGSAALDLAYVAAGKVDGFWEMDLNLYDVAAGILLVEEAGGLISDMKGGASYPEQGIVAGNGYIMDQLLHDFSSI